MLGNFSIYSLVNAPRVRFLHKKSISHIAEHIQVVVGQSEKVERYQSKQKSVEKRRG